MYLELRSLFSGEDPWVAAVDLLDVGRHDLDAWVVWDESGVEVRNS